MCGALDLVMDHRRGNTGFQRCTRACGVYYLSDPAFDPDPNLKRVLIIHIRARYLLVGFHLVYLGYFGSIWTGIVGSWPGDRGCCFASISFWCFLDFSLWVTFYCDSLVQINLHHQCIVGLYSSIRSIFHNLRKSVGGGSFSCADNSLYWGSLRATEELIRWGRGMSNYNWGTALAWLQVRGYEEHKTQRTIQLYCIWINWVLLHHFTNVGDTQVAETLRLLLVGQMDMYQISQGTLVLSGQSVVSGIPGKTNDTFFCGQGWLVWRKNKIRLHSFNCPFRRIKSYHTLTSGR